MSYKAKRLSRLGFTRKRLSFRTADGIKTIKAWQAPDERSVQSQPETTTEELVLRCRCGEFTRFLKHTGAVYRSTIGCCGHERFTRWIYDHSLSCDTGDGQWLTVEPMPIGGAE